VSITQVMPEGIWMKRQARGESKARYDANVTGGYIHFLIYSWEDTDE
jgi:hypothetical protein